MGQPACRRTEAPSTARRLSPHAKPHTLHEVLGPPHRAAGTCAAPPRPTAAAGKEQFAAFPFPGAPGSIAGGLTVSSQLKAYGTAKLGELTALHIAAERGSAEMVRLLVAAGAKANVQGDKSGMPPLHVAVWEGNTAAVLALLAHKVGRPKGF